jgi:fatty acid desaturase
MAQATSDYEAARARLVRKRKFRGDVVAYVVVNVFLVILWAATGAGYFWPGWVMGGWGALLVLDGWDAYYRREVTDEDVERELGKRP